MTTRRPLRRTTLLAFVVAVLVLLAVAFLVLGARDDEPVPSSTDHLADSSTSVDQALLAWRERHGSWPARAETSDSGFRASGDGTSVLYDPGVDPGVSLEWYLRRGAAQGYCLRLGSYHLTSVTTGGTTSSTITKRTTTGACPAPGLQPPRSTG